MIRDNMDRESNFHSVTVIEITETGVSLGLTLAIIGEGTKAGHRVFCDCEYSSLE